MVAMGLIFHIVILVFTVFVVLAAVLFAVVDMFGRVDYLKEHLPWLNRVLERHSAIGVLLLGAIFLLVGDGLELIGKEVPEMPPPPQFIVKGPVPPMIQVHLVAAPRESKNSLRRRTMLVADEVYTFVIERQLNHPPNAYPDSQDPNPSVERKQEIKRCQAYDQESWNQFVMRYRDRMTGIVKEYEARGIRTRYLENDFLAYHVDAYDNAIHF